MRNYLCAVPFAILVMTGAAVAEDWPQWRGPNRDGISKEQGLLREWPAEGPPLVWQVHQLGGGYSTPSVAGGRVFLINNEGLDDEFVQALDAKNGERIWKLRLGKVGNPDQQPSYPGARSTPTVDGNLVYALSSDGDLVCIEAASGKERWRKNLRTDFGGKPGKWAYAESPLVDRNTLVVTPGGKEAMIVALNKANGDVIWKSPSELPDGEPAGYASAIVLNAAGFKQYVQFCGKGLVGVDAKNGKTLWRYDRTGKDAAATIATPVAADGYVYTGTHYTGGGAVKLSRDGRGVKAEEVYYSNKEMPTAIGGSLLLGDFLYGTNKEQTLCLVFKTGEVKWKEPRVVTPASVLYADDRLYMHGQEEGELALLAASPDGYQEHGRFTPANLPEKREGKAWEYPVIANGKLYIFGWGTLSCYDIKAPSGSRAALRKTAADATAGN